MESSTTPLRNSMRHNTSTNKDVLPYDRLLDFSSLATKEKYFECIYDGVVGSTEESVIGGHLTIDDLKKMKTIARGMVEEDPNLHRGWLHALEKACDTYVDLLEDKTSCIPRKSDHCANRHTLARIKRFDGKFSLMEMTNSMSKAEVARFKEKTGFIISQIENAPDFVRENGRAFRKIELGKGAFGKTRIARDVMDDKFLAIKKTHPKLGIGCNEDGEICIQADDPVKSGFEDFSVEKLNLLDRLAHVIALPRAECSHETATSQALDARLDRFQTFTKITQLQEVITELKKAGISFDGQDRDPIFLLKLLQLVQDIPKADQREKTRTNFTFSELAITTVEQVIESLNLQKYSFEENNFNVNDEAQLSQCFKQLTAYSLKFYSLSRHDGGSAHLVHYQKAGIDRFLSENFYLKYPNYNIRFQNTLGKKMLESLSALHKYGLSHQDIKPDNIVISIDENKNAVVKLIDMDFMTSTAQIKQMPDAGCRMYMPPEARIPERDGSYSYTPVNGDGFAMGLSLRAVAGYGKTELAITSELQGMSESNQKKQLKAWKESKDAWVVAADSPVQRQSFVAAKMAVEPKLVLLRDIADTMLKSNPGKRQTCTEVLNWQFFKENKNFLSDSDFTEHLLRVVRFGVVSDKSDIERVNDKTIEQGGYLSKLRTQSRLKHREHFETFELKNSPHDSFKSIDAAIASKDSRQQAEAVLRRVVRAMTAMTAKVTFTERGSIADKVLGYERKLFK